jgi:cytochrome c biogenesis protein CcdA
VAVALIALFFGLVNVKDYFFYKEGLSFTIDDKQKPGIYQRMRRVLDASQSFWGLAGATVVMSAGVSLVEFSCTAGFPVLWTNIVAAQKVSALTFALLLLLYLIIYQIDEMAIFLTAVFTLKASRMEEKHGRILKLIGGMLMLTLAGVMVVNPRLMNDLGSSLIIFGVAFAAAGLVLLLHRKILPAFGIWIGSEKNARSR